MSDISIIIPAYNAQDYIKKCLSSCQRQTHKNIEIIIVDDGSTDNTAKIIKSFKDERIKYYKNANHGIGYTRNYGIIKSSSPYIMFLDSDDYLREDACEVLLKKAQLEDLDLVICNFYRVINNHHLEEILPRFSNTNLRKTPSLLSEINLSPWNKLYKSSLIKDNNIKFIENLKYEDAPFVSIAMDKANKIGKVEECLYYYNIREKSETTIRDEKCFDILKIINIMKDYFMDKEYVKESFNQLVVRTITNYTIQQRVQSNKKIGASFIDAAFDYLKENVPDYKANKYYKSRGLLRRTIEKNKVLTKLYCLLYK